MHPEPPRDGLPAVKGPSALHWVNMPQSWPSVSWSAWAMQQLFEIVCL